MPDWVLWRWRSWPPSRPAGCGASGVVGWPTGARARRRHRRPDDGDPTGRGGRPGRTGFDRNAAGPGGPEQRPAPARGADRRPAGAPQPGEIWWADVPYADGTGSKVRPCLVLRADGRGADVLKITSQDKSDRDDHVRIPTRSWDADADHDSFLDVSEPIHVPEAAFADRAGSCDPTLWRQVRKLPHLAV
ncbi:type II toxin-antitoxin system PemK/MazF family toxin [Micromonospora sp. R77]|uniref:type II toxin-antitoxin system PemK/MazF family toxin n=1 Tax=Micromonospora sp. R77 TaxID=2925836 RepID=UPI001F620377|nr:type II toxin-antitoxin system PemK/MazF family toxin [Micromonospora sp. R77]MCI4064652.1 type II toxin-antitoxin system PemK/MazF family toxin [Micromonospora sp. R77]